jgi:hypothetical protein
LKCHLNYHFDSNFAKATLDRLLKLILGQRTLALAKV